MAEPAILFVRPKAIKPADKKRLADVGVVVIEVEDPTAVKFTRPSAEIETTEMLALAARALSECGLGYANQLFGKLIGEALMAKAKDTPP